MLALLKYIYMTEVQQKQKGLRDDVIQILYLQHIEKADVVWQKMVRCKRISVRLRKYLNPTQNFDDRMKSWDSFFEDYKTIVSILKESKAIKECV